MTTSTSTSFLAIDVLSVVSDIFCRKDGGLEAVYGIAAAVCGFPVWSHELPTVIKLATPRLLEQHPFLKEYLPVPKGSKEETFAWVQRVAHEFGDKRIEISPVDPLKRLSC